MLQNKKQMSTDPMSEHARIPRHWERPFKGAYASHTANFLSVQLVLWARILMMCTSLSFDIKLTTLYYSDWIASSIVLLGFAGTIPYTLSSFREGEVSIGRGPSIVSELIPQWITSGVLILVFFVLEIADYFICTHLSLGLERWYYIGLSLGGVALFVISPDDFNNRLIVSCAVFNICVLQPTWFMDWSVVGPTAGALVASSLMDAYVVQGNRNVLLPLETEILRVRVICKILLVLCLIISIFNEFAFLCVIAVISCNIFFYIQERRYGTLLERRCLRELPLRLSNAHA